MQCLPLAFFLTQCHAGLDAVGHGGHSPARGAGRMSTHIFTPQDACEGRCRIQVPRYEEGAQASRATTEAHPFQVLEEGSRVHRVDNDNVRRMGRGTCVTLAADRKRPGHSSHRYERSLHPRALAECSAAATGDAVRRRVGSSVPRRPAEATARRRELKRARTRVRARCVAGLTALFPRPDRHCSGPLRTFHADVLLHCSARRDAYVDDRSASRCALVE